MGVPVAITLYAVCEAFVRADKTTVHRILIFALPLATALFDKISLYAANGIRFSPLITAVVLVMWCITDIVMTAKSKA